MDFDIEMGDAVEAYPSVDVYAPAENDILPMDDAQEPGEIEENDGEPAATGAAETASAISADAEATTLVPNKIHIRGLDTFNPNDIKAYLAEHAAASGTGAAAAPSPPASFERIEWIDDSSANLVFASAAAAADALVALSALAILDPAQLPVRELLPAKPYSGKPDATALLQVRFAVAADKKQVGAAARSRFYLLHPEYDPEERHRQRGGSGGGPLRSGRDNYRRDYRDRRGDGGYRPDRSRHYGARDEEREADIRNNAFDVSLYDDDDGGSSHKASSQRRPRTRSRSVSSSHSSSYSQRRRGSLYRRNRDKELFPGDSDRRNAGRELFPDSDRRAGRELFPDSDRRAGRELFPDSDRRNAGRELFPSKKAKELFPDKLASSASDGRIDRARRQSDDRGRLTASSRRGRSASPRPDTGASFYYDTNSAGAGGSADADNDYDGRLADQRAMETAAARNRNKARAMKGRLSSTDNGSRERLDSTSEVAASLSDRITRPADSADSADAFHIRGMAGSANGSSGLTIKGTAGAASTRELFPVDKYGRRRRNDDDDYDDDYRRSRDRRSGAGSDGRSLESRITGRVTRDGSSREHYSDKLENRIRPRQRAEDSFR